MLYPTPLSRSSAPLYTGTIAVADLHSKILDSYPPRSISSFYTVFGENWQNNGFVSAFGAGVLPPSSGKSWISRCMHPSTLTENVQRLFSCIFNELVTSNSITKFPILEYLIYLTNGTKTSVANLHSKILVARPPLGPICFISMQFSAKFSQIID